MPAELQQAVVERLVEVEELLQADPGDLLPVEVGPQLGHDVGVR
jgi:hypothetical protein